jgi:lipopolysaccharide biosynthesis glycosyltransferase
MNSVIQNTQQPEDIRFNIAIPPDETPFFHQEITAVFPNPAFQFRLQEFKAPLYLKTYLDGRYQEKREDRRISRRMQFARFYLGELFPGLQRAIYLDTDLVVLRDIRELFYSEVQFTPDCYFAAVPHWLPPFMHFHKPWLAGAEIRAMSKTFNSGVLMTDFAYWTEETYSRLKYYLDLEKRANYYLYKVGDETILNLMFKDFIRLPRDWNRAGYGNCHLIANSLRCDLNQAGVIHWSGGYHKPWNSPNIVYGHLWKRYNPAL